MSSRNVLHAIGKRALGAPRIVPAALLLLSAFALPASAGDAKPVTTNAAAARIESALARDERPDAAQARSLAADGAVLLDVRNQDEWNEGHAKGAIFLPWREVDDQAAAKLPNKDAPIVTYCAAGVRAAFAARSLRKLGYTHVVAMTGGYDDLRKLGYPTE